MTGDSAVVLIFALCVIEAMAIGTLLCRWVSAALRRPAEYRDTSRGTRH